MQNNLKIIKKDVKYINLKVKPNCEVVLTAPKNTTDEYIEYILDKRKAWIQKHINYFKTKEIETPKKYISGENFKYLGKSYRLKVFEAGENDVKLYRGYIYLFVKDKSDYSKKEKLINEWYKNRAKIHFEKIVIKYSKIVKKEVKSLKIREMKSRWGSCNPIKSYINLNLNLIKKPSYTIEYVVLHELAHLTHPNHSKEFYNYLTLYMPDWKWRREKLNL